MVGRQSGFGEDNEAAGFWVLPRSGCRYNTVNWIRQGEEENILEVGPRSRKVRSFRVSEVYLKKPSQIQALAMVMVLCLFIYSMTEFRLRRELEQTGETVTSQTKKQTRKPTLKWVFFLFRRVREFVIVVEDGRRLKRVTNMNEELWKILRLLGREYENYYI